MRQIIRRLFLAAAILLSLSSLSACASQSATESIFAMDTVMELTAYADSKNDAQAAVSDGVMEINRLDHLLSTTNDSSDIWAINHSTSPISISETTSDILSVSLDLCRQTNGALDISIYPVLTAWGFTTGSYQVPDQARISELLTRIDYTQISLDNAQVAIPSNFEIDLGAVTKGYTGDRVIEIMKQHGITNALLDLGGNIQVLGNNPETNNPWRIGIKDPFDSEEYFCILSVMDTAVVTSGGYERYFEEDGVTYWHIIDPKTGYPADSGLASVTILCPSGVTADALSTALFVKGLAEARDFYHTVGGFEAVFVTEDGQIWITPGLTGNIKLAQKYDDLRLQVIE